ncbi:MAG: response regulator [Chitinivibrionales bacterium]|nr:response regulator [Chitinivibrionales bacterium]
MIPKKILVIDDERLIRHTTVLLLKKEGAEVLAAEEGKQGIELAKNEHPDLILLDIMMPGMDGWQVLETLRSEPLCASVPVIIFTAVDFTTSQKKAAEQGAQGILRKPFHLHELKAILGIEQEGGTDG